MARPRKAAQAKTADQGEEPRKRRNRRSADQMIADLQVEIERIKTRAAAKQVKQSDDGKALLVAVKALDRASIVAAEAGNKPMVQALERARAPLSELLVEKGIRLPEKRGKRRLQAV